MRFIARENGREVEVQVERHGAGYRVRIGDRWIEADFVRVGNYVRSLRLADGTQYSLVHHHHGNTHEITMRGAMFEVDVIDPLAAKRRNREDGGGSTGIVKALMPGRVVRVLVSKGDTVAKGAGLLILEAMKMENEIQAEKAGTVAEVKVKPGDTVGTGDVVVVITSPVLVFLMRTSSPARGPRTLDRTPRNSPVPACASSSVLHAQIRATMVAWRSCDSICDC